MSIPIKIRIRLLKYILWIIIIGGMIPDFPEFKEGFKDGYEEGASYRRASEAGKRDGENAREVLMREHFTQLSVEALSPEISDSARVHQGFFNASVQKTRTYIHVETEKGASVLLYTTWASVGLTTCSICYLLCCIFMLIFLTRFLNACERGAMFTAANIRRTRWVAATLILIPIFEFIYARIESAAYQKALEIEGYRIVSDLRIFDFTFVAIGVAVFVVAELFRISKDMQEEQSLIV